MEYYVKQLLHLLLASAFISNISVQSANILIVCNVPSVSHSIWNNKLAKMLADHGHQITLVDTDPKRFDHQNITHIHVDGAYDYFRDYLATLESMESMVEDYSVLNNIKFITNPAVYGCRTLLLSDVFKSFINDYKNYRFDLIIFDFGCEAFYGLVPYFGDVPFVIATAFGDPFYISQIAAGLHDNPSYVPYPFSDFLPHMSFIERLYNTFYMLYFQTMVNVYSIPYQQSLMEEVFGESIGQIEDIAKNVALVMSTYHPAIYGPKPLPPSVISISGFHIGAVKPLPKDIKKFLDEAKNGVIYFSLGSNLKSTLMSKKNIQIFLDVFKEIPQRVLWKLEIEDTSNIPPNVMLAKWLPQNDVLAHQNIRCFISHGGFNGIQEAVHHGVPILGMPIFFDQVSLIERLAKEGAAVSLHYPKLSRTYFKEQLTKILEDKSIKEKVKVISEIFRDSPQTPRERTLYWIEYVIRNPSRIKYLKSESVNLSWYQRTLLDVAMVIFSVFLCLGIVVFKLLSCFKRFVF